MTTQIPYNIVLFPCCNLEDVVQFSSITLADKLSRVGNSEIYNVEVMDFSYDYEIFLDDKTLLNNQRNEAFFVDLFKDKIFKPGIVTFFVNFEMDNFLLIMTHLQKQKPDLKALIIATSFQYIKWSLSDCVKNVDCCIHSGEMTKSIMYALKLTQPSH